MNATEAFANEMEKTVLYPASWPKHEHFNNFGGEVGQDASDHLSELEDKKLKQIQNYSEIEQLMTFLKELQKRGGGSENEGTRSHSWVFP
jgi:hypothetical protein